MLNRICKTHRASQVVVKNPPANAEDAGLISGSERSPGEGNGNPLQYSGLGNPTDRGAWRATIHGVTELDMTQQLSIHMVDSYYKDMKGRLLGRR